MSPSIPKQATLESVGNYDLLEKIAEGGMGGVYKARHRLSGELVAIKVMPTHMANNAVLLRRFEQEFRAASKLDHPNIVRALEYGESGSGPFLVMELVDGESLGSKLEREGTMSVTEAIRLISQVAQGLHRAHKEGMVHRDVKPDNILIGNDGVAKLADLGLVKEVEADLNLTRTGRGLGTPHFMAPEQFRNAKNADIRCDIYSLGATLYQMITGELPFRSNGPLDAWMKKINNELTPPRKIVKDIPERVEWAILRAMSADPDRRPMSCREFVEDLTGHSTRRLPTTGSGGEAQDLWYLVYRDEEGNTHTVKGTTGAIRRSLKEGLLGDASNVRAARKKSGPFELLSTYPEFRDLLIAAAPVGVSTPTPTRSRRSKTTKPRPTMTPQKEEQPSPKTPVKSEAPHIQLGESDDGENEWLKWVLLIVIAIASAGLAFILIPMFS